MNDVRHAPEPGAGARRARHRHRGGWASPAWGSPTTSPRWVKRDILLVEGNELASGCTGGSLGGVRQQFSTPVEVEIALRGKRFWQTFEETFDSPCAYHQDGYLMLTGRQEIYASSPRAADVQREAGAGPVEMLSAADVESQFPYLSGEGLLGGCWTPEDGRVNPTDGVYGLAAAARAKGVTIQQHWPVSSIEKAPGGWTVVGPERITAPAGDRGSRAGHARAHAAFRSRPADHADAAALRFHDRGRAATSGSP